MIWPSRSKAAHAYSRWRILFPLYYVPVWGCGFDCWHRGGWWCASRCRTRMGWKRQPAINTCQSLLCTFSDHYQPLLPTFIYIYTYTCVYVYNVCLYLCVLYIYMRIEMFEAFWGFLSGHFGSSSVGRAVLGWGWGLGLATWRKWAKTLNGDSMEHGSL